MALIAAPSAHDRRAIAQMLGSIGALRLVEAKSGDEALALVRSEALDLAVLDAALPGVHAFDICRRLRADDRTARLPLIVASGGAWRGWRVGADLREAFGVSAFLEKPLRADLLLRAVDLALGGGQAGVKNGKPMGAAADLLREALAQQRAGQLPAAIDLAREAVLADPMATQTRSQLAALLIKAGAVFDAMHELEEVAHLYPGSFAALRGLALLYEKRGFPRRAISAWERALRAAPSSLERDQIRRHLMDLLGETLV